MYPYLSEALEQVEPRPAAYVLLGADGAYLYKGACRNLQQRLRDHRAGRASHTKNRRPLRLFFVEYFDSYEEALRKERYLKTGFGRAGLKRRLNRGA